MNTFRLQLAGSALWRSSSALSEKHISRILSHQKDAGTITILSSSVVNDPSYSLVGGFNISTHLKNMSSSVEMITPNILWKHPLKSIKPLIH